MKFRLNPKLLAVWLAVCAVAGLGMRYFTGLPFWGGFLIAAVGLLINGAVAHIEDQEPGGFSSTGRESKPK